MSAGGPTFTVIEGLDGSGKSTLARALADRTRAELLRTPPSELAGVRPLVDSVLGNHSLSRVLLYASCVAEASERARELLASGRSVVLDRYWLTTLAYAELSGTTPDLSGVEQLLLQPTLTLFLSVPRAVRQDRIERRGPLSPHDRDSLEYEKALADAYLRHARRFCGHNFRLFSAEDRTPGELAEVICREVRP